jgi:para-aminobenzoate synthetase/4-amino-4-deoxychorismate lyase
MTPFSLPPRALLTDDARPGGRSWLYRDPIDWIEAHDPAAAAVALRRIDAAIAGGLWVAGGFAFELGYLLEPKLRPLYRPGPDPLIAVGVYRAREAVDGAAAFAALGEGRACDFGAPLPFWTEDQYGAVFRRVRDYIAAGDIYQLNLTWPLTLPFDGDPFGHLAAWRRRAKAGHEAILRLDDRDILSFSPELFLSSDGDGIVRTRPMKGTAARGADLADDARAAAALVSDVKQRAENLMIVDLLRNDLSRICLPGSVRVTDLFSVETYPTLHTMTTGVEGRMRDGIPPSDVLGALFPCGSVTGAPKVRAMEIIAETEPQPRGIYCGAIGAIGPGLQMSLNVAIRTLVHQHGTAALRMGVGGGLVYDSDAASEYAECLLKARFITERTEPFDLLETMRWLPVGGFLFLDEHLARLAEAARYFLRPFDEGAVRAALASHVANGSSDLRVRLLLKEGGGAHVESSPLNESFTLDHSEAPAMRVVIAEARLRSANPFARHKTTLRAPYDRALSEAKAAGADEAILLNEHGRVADGSFMTVFIRRDGRLLTPSRSEGALDGVLKRALRRQGGSIEEHPLTVPDLHDAETLLVGNSVRGLRRAIMAGVV